MDGPQVVDWICYNFRSKDDQLVLIIIKKKYEK